MKKLCLTLAVCCMAALAVCGAEPLISLIPEVSCGVLSVDLTSLWRHPQVVEALQKPEIAEELAEVETMLGCKLSDLEEILIFVDKDPAESNYVGCLIRSRAAAKLFAAAANPETIGTVNRKAAQTGKVDKEKKLNSRTEKVDGRDVVVFSDSPKPAEDDIALVSLTPEVLLAARRDVLPKMLKDGRIASAELDRILKARIPGRYPLWGVWYDPEGKTVEPPKDPKAPKVEEKLIGLGLAWGFIGKEQLDQRIVALLRCNTRAFASTLGMMIPGYAQMGAAMAFQKQPELGQELLANFRCEVKDFNVYVSLSLPQTLLKKVETFATDNKVVAAPDPVPRDIQAK